MESNTFFLRDASTWNRYSCDTTTHIIDINHDCLGTIFRKLDITSQFSVLQTHPLFLNVILFDIWYQYYENKFDVSKDCGIFEKSSQFQCEFLCFVLSRFPRVVRVPSFIFNICMRVTEQIIFSNVLELSIHHVKQSDCIISIKDLSRFSNLQILNLQNVSIDFRNGEKLENVKELSIISSHITNDEDGEFLRTLTTSNLEKFDFRPPPKQLISQENFNHISNCVNLEEFTVYFHCIKNVHYLKTVLSMSNLRKLTLYSFNNFYFSLRDHELFKGVIEKLWQTHKKHIAVLDIYGIPDKCLFSNSHIKNVNEVTWSVDKIFHKKIDGYVVWSTDLRDTCNSFYDLVGTSKTLERICVVNNILHSNRLLEDPRFEYDLQMRRLRANNGAITIISNCTGGVLTREECGVHTDGFVSFIMLKPSSL